MSTSGRSIRGAGPLDEIPTIELCDELCRRSDAAVIALKRFDTRTGTFDHNMRRKGSVPDLLGMTEYSRVMLANELLIGDLRSMLNAQADEDEEGQVV